MGGDLHVHVAMCGDGDYRIESNRSELSGWMVLVTVRRSPDRPHSIHAEARERPNRWRETLILANKNGGKDSLAKINRGKKVRRKCGALHVRWCTIDDHDE